MGWKSHNISIEVDLDDYRDEIISYLEENPVEVEHESDNRFEDTVHELFLDIHAIRAGHRELDIEYLQDLHDKLKEILNG